MCPFVGGPQCGRPDRDSVLSPVVGTRLAGPGVPRMVLFITPARPASCPVSPGRTRGAPPRTAGYYGAGSPISEGPLHAPVVPRPTPAPPGAGAAHRDRSRRRRTRRLLVGRRTEGHRRRVPDRLALR